MEDAIDDLILRQIQWHRREDVVARGIRWIQDVLWPDGTFFIRLGTQSLLNGYQFNQASVRTRQQGSQNQGLLNNSFKLLAVAQMVHLSPATWSA